MIEVKVLGVGCANCKTTQDLIEKVCFKPSLSPARTRFKEITHWAKIGFC
jgi:hypothetical protein